MELHLVTLELVLSYFGRAIRVLYVLLQMSINFEIICAIQCNETMQPEPSGSDCQPGGQGRFESARQTAAFAPESAMD